MPTAERRLSVWALPAPDDRAVLRTAIDELAATTATKGFDPHVTLASADGQGGDGVRIERLSTALGGIHAVTVTCEEVVATDEWFRALVLRVGATDALVSLHRGAGDALGALDEAYWPHLSLWYGDLDETAKVPLRAMAAPLAPRPLTLDAVVLVDVTDVNHTTWATIARWPLR